MRILIVGGGIAGLTLNLALRDGPWQVDLVERRPDRTAPGAGLALQPNAMRALRRLGVASAVERAGAVIGSFQYRDRTGALLCDVDLDDLWRGVGPFVGIARAALHEILGSGGARCRTATSVDSVRQDGESVTVRFGDGAVSAYDLVVGADGITSAVRRSVFGERPPVDGGQTVWRSVAPVRPGKLEAVQFWLGTDRFFGLCPVGNGATYGFGNIAGVGQPDPVAGRRHRLADAFASFGDPVHAFLSALDDDADIHCAPVRWLPDAVYHRGRVALVGDAAHAMSPMMGQGGCMAVEDAVVLAEELRRSADVTTALAAFEHRRRPRLDPVRRNSEALHDLVRLPAARRDEALRERGAEAFRERYRPLLAAP